MFPHTAQGYPAAGAAAASPLNGQPAFLSPPDPGSHVPVGIPVGAVHGSAAYGGGSAFPGAPVAHVGGALPCVAHAPAAMGGAHMINAPLQPASYANHTAMADQAQQGRFAHSSGYSKGPASTDFLGHSQQHWPSSPPPSSFPPGFEPKQNISIASGIPAGANPAVCAQGGPITPGNQHQGHFQQQHEYQKHHQQQSCQGLSSSQTLHQQRHQCGPQGPHTAQRQHQHQHQHLQSPRAAQSQHQQHNPLYQGQCKSQNQHQQHNSLYQGQCKSQNQHQQQFPGQQNMQHRYRPQKHRQYEQPQCQQASSPAQVFSRGQHSNFQQSSSHPQPQPQHNAICKQAQPPPQSHQPGFQSCNANGVAIGVPVTPMHPNIDAIRAQSVVHSQQVAANWQKPNHMENFSLISQRNLQDNHPAVPILQGEVCLNSRIPSNFHKAGESCAMSAPIPNSHSELEGMKSANSSRIKHAQVKANSESGTAHPISPVENNQRNWPSPRHGQMRSGTGAGNHTRTPKNYGSPSNGRRSKFHNNRPLPGYREKFDDGQHGLQFEKADFKGKPFSKGLVTMSDAQPSRCEPCDRLFATSEVLADHLKSHVKCGEEGCFFEAAGKIVKEHRVVEHGKVEFQSTSRGLKALALRSMEDKEDIKRWREERKRSYPTSGNIFRKAEEKRKREAEGESIDEDAQLRRQRMMDIIAKQKQLGYQVPEIPSHYFRAQYSRQPKKGRRDNNVALPAAQENSGTHTLKEDKGNADHANGYVKTKEAGNDSIDKQDTEASFHDQENANDNQCKSGHVKKARHKKSSSRRDRRKSFQKSPQKAQWWQKSSPSLLSKLLSKDIEAENSCLMQCCRFIVNNGFLQGCSLSSLKHFKWTKGFVADDEGDPSANVLDCKSALKSDGREELSTSSSNSSACAEESNELHDLKDAIAITKDLTTKQIDGRTNDGASHEMEVSKEFVGKKGRDIYHFCPHEDSEKMKSHGDNNVQRNGSPSACVTLNRPAGSKSICDVLAVKNPRLEGLPPQNSDTAKAASENSGSVVDNEDDFSQYMNLDVSVEDFGCCC